MIYDRICNNDIYLCCEQSKIELAHLQHTRIRETLSHQVATDVQTAQATHHRLRLQPPATGKPLCRMNTGHTKGLHMS